MYKEIDMIFSKKITIKKLKDIAKQYKLKKISRLKKKELQTKIYNHLYKEKKATIIQTAYKQYLLRRLLSLQGPARLNRSQCTNDTDFYDLDPLNELSWINFISYKDDNNHMFGFSLKSLYNLYLKHKDNSKQPLNPYNLQELPKKLYARLVKLIRYANLLSIKIDITHEIVKVNKIDSKVNELFAKIDELDNYSNPEWLLHLTKHELLSYLKELKDIFFYRANINGIKRFLICPFQNGDPFYDTQLHSLQLKPYNYVLNKTIDIIKRFIMYSNDIQYNKLGSLYVLIAFTIVSMDARTALPELYYSVNYNS